MLFLIIFFFYCCSENFNEFVYAHECEYECARARYDGLRGSIITMHSKTNEISEYCIRLSVRTTTNGICDSHMNVERVYEWDIHVRMCVVYRSCGTFVAVINIIGAISISSPPDDTSDLSISVSWKQCDLLLLLFAGTYVYYVDMIVFNVSTDSSGFFLIFHLSFTSYFFHFAVTDEKQDRVEGIAKRALIYSANTSIAESMWTTGRVF